MTKNTSTELLELIFVNQDKAKLAELIANNRVCIHNSLVSIFNDYSLGNLIEDLLRIPEFDLSDPETRTRLKEVSTLFFEIQETYVEAQYEQHQKLAKEHKISIS